MPSVTASIWHIPESRTSNPVSPGGFFQRLPPGWSQREGTWGRNPIPSGLPGKVAGNVPKVLGNDAFYGLRARASVCRFSAGSSHSEGPHAEVRKGLQEPRKGHHPKLTMARTGGGQEGNGHIYAWGTQSCLLQETAETVRRQPLREPSPFAKPFHSHPLMCPPQPPPSPSRLGEQGAFTPICP